MDKRTCVTDNLSVNILPSFLYICYIFAFHLTTIQVTLSNNGKQNGL